MGAALLTFLTSLASFSAPYIFGGGFRVMTTQIVSTRLNGDDRLAMVETTALTVLALGAMALFRRATRAARSRAWGRGTPPRWRAPAAPARVRESPRRPGCSPWCSCCPTSRCSCVSFVPVGTWTIETLPPAFSPGNYAALFAEPERLRPLLNSLWMATAATVAAIGVALAAG